MPYLKVIEVRTGHVFGTVTLSEDGELCASPPGVKRDIENMAAVRHMSPREAFETLLQGWSNGYVQIIAAD